MTGCVLKLAKKKQKGLQMQSIIVTASYIKVNVYEWNIIKTINRFQFQCLLLWAGVAAKEQKASELAQ